MYEYKILDIEDKYKEAQDVTLEYKLGTLDPGRLSNKFEGKMASKRRKLYQVNKRKNDAKDFGLDVIESM